MVFQHSLHIAALYASFHILFYIFLGVLVVIERNKTKTGLGDGGLPHLQRLIRVHGNYAEYLGPILAVLIFLALLFETIWAVHVFGFITLLARLLHAQGLYQSHGVTFGRAAGTAMTWTALGVGSLALIFMGLFG
jgi:uncharacterized membrane protein YecN with MAPEG domain